MTRINFASHKAGIRCIVTMLAAVLCAVSTAHAEPYDKTPAGITDASRDASIADDFMRAIWVAPGRQVAFLGRNDSAVKNLRRPRRLVVAT